MSTDCLFCRIADGSLPSSLIFADQDLVAFNDIHPVAPVHILLVPRKHIVSVADAADADADLVGKLVLRAKRLAEEQGIATDGYRLVFNVRRHAGQAVDHLHLHLIGGQPLGHLG